MVLEIIAFNIESCLSAQNAGAGRIELCANPGEGGTTPSLAFIKEARRTLEIDLYVMIRHRGGNFMYNEQEISIMKDDIAICKDEGCDGIVLGMLNEDGKIDIGKCRRLVGYAYPLGVTFHRAFDRAVNPLQALEEIIECGCERILTSGQKPKVMEGTALIKLLIEKAEDRIIIMPGSGINSSNIADIARETGATEFHSSASLITNKKFDYQNEIRERDQGYVIVNPEEVTNMKKKLAAFHQES
jgi:copper homeostasis protein